MTHNFRQRLRALEPLIGTMITLDTPATAEVLAQLGFDWFFVDGEHGPLESAELLGILRAVDHKVPCVVRVPAAEETPIKKVLDIGAAGVIVPMVNTPEQAAEVVRHARYAPQGSRGVGLARAHGYGLTFGDYVENANETVSVIVQAEHIDAVNNIERIVQVEGIDAIQLGPYDLSASMGKMGQVDDPEVIQAIDHVIKTCQEAGLAIGWFGVTAEAVRPYLDRGCTLMTAGVDTLMLASAGKRVLKVMRDE
ncbi:MAG: 2,4-dihydroxyhept-2-ene-1,7-dioic acid aldolase [Planctomycetaceae bacterium]|nr:2,4-dihydroxyhept-2-ene-1,7-dioic acid aldolase [Planctomycetaceae bacterium]